MKPFRSIKGKLIISTLSISLIPIFIITTIYYFNLSSTVEKQILDNLKAVAESKRMHVLHFMEAKKERVIDFGSDGFIRDYLETITRRGYQSYAVAGLNRHLKVNKKPLDSRIKAIYILDLEGKIVSSTDETSIGKDMSKQEMYIRGISRKHSETYISQSYNTPYLNFNCIFISAPVISKGGAETKIGVIVNAYDLASLSEITTERTGLGESGEVYLVNNSDKKMLTESRFIDGAPLKQVVDTEPVRKIIEDGKVMTGIYLDYRGIPIIGTSLHIPEYGWTLLSEIDVAEAFAPLRMTGIIALIVGGSCAAVAVCGGIVFSSLAAMPISRLKDAAYRFARGDMDYRVNIANKDEIGDLARSFNDMVERLSNIIEEHKRTEEELTVINKELESFCYSVSHDLRAPLRSIDGFSKMLVEDLADKLDSQGKDNLQRVRTASQRMGQLIDDLLDLSRIARSDIRQERVDLSAMAKSIAVELQKRQPERQIEFVISEGVFANGDKRLLQVAMDNLLDNAWKFTGKHSHARIEFGILQNDSRHVYFVSDDGAGFDMTYADKLFGAFQRLHTLSEFEGTGIGLATTQRIIHRHGGRIWAEGVVEHGATFYFTLM